MRTAHWPAAAPVAEQRSISKHLIWYGGGVVVGFLIPFVFTSLLDIHHDLYYLVYFALAGGFLGAYVSATGVNMVELFTRRWKLSLGFGLLAAAFVVQAVLTRDDSTARPGGAYLWFEVLWRGAVYGAVDALLLTAFPVAVAFALHGQRLGTWTRRLTFALTSMVLVAAITASYHLGYEQFREDGVGAPEFGNAVISVPAIATVNPAGSVLAHMSMHVAAVVHSYETDTYLPPQTDAD